MADETKAPVAKTRWVKYLLILSLGLNLAVVGLVGGHILRGAPDRPARPDHEIGALGLRLYYHALDEDHRQALNAAVKDRRGQFHAGRAALQAHRLALAETLEAVPFDASAVQQILAQQGEYVRGNVKVGHDLLIERIVAMSPEARAAMAARLKSGDKRNRMR